MLMRLKVITLLLISSLLIGCSSASARSPIPLPSVRTVLPLFQPVLTQLQEQTQISVVLPTWIPTDALVPSPDDKSQPYIDVPLTEDGYFQQVSISITTSTRGAYELSLNAVPNCQGAFHCSFGLLAGQQVYRDTPSIQSEYAFESQPDFQPIARSPEAMGEVTLAQGIHGYFVPFVCGANCDTSKIIWEQNSYRYRVGIRMASKATMIKFANSVIENELKP